MINLRVEKLLGFAGAGRSFPPTRGDKQVHPATVFRYHKDGARAIDGTIVKLEALKIGGRYVTSEEAIDRFIAALNCTDAPPAASAERVTATAKKRLAAAGI